MKTLFLILILAVMSVAQVPQCTSTGQAFWTVTPFLSQIYGCAGSGVTFTEILMQGYVGVIQITASRIQLDGAVYINGNPGGRPKWTPLMIGPPDSAGVGRRMVWVGN